MSGSVDMVSGGQDVFFFFFFFFCVNHQPTPPTPHVGSNRSGRKPKVPNRRNKPDISNARLSAAGGTEFDGDEGAEAAAIDIQVGLGAGFV